MDSVVQNYEHKLSAVKNASKKEINELKECYNSLVKEQDMIIARDKVVVTFSILIL
jgi:Ca2+-binding EF-hand superfamily protein